MGSLYKYLYIVALFLLIVSTIAADTLKLVPESYTTEPNEIRNYTLKLEYNNIQWLRIDQDTLPGELELSDLNIAGGTFGDPLDSTWIQITPAATSGEITLHFNGISLSATHIVKFRHHDGEYRYFDFTLEVSACALNQIITNTGCETCPNNVLPDSTQTTCDHCSYGQYFDSSENKCEACTGNTISDQNRHNETSCSECPPHSVSNNDHTKCLCGEGAFYNSGDDKCETCPAGTVNPNTAHADETCQECDDEQITTDHITCESCPERMTPSTTKDLCVCSPAYPYTLEEDVGEHSAGCYNDCSVLGLVTDQDNQRCHQCPEGSRPNHDWTACVDHEQCKVISADGVQCLEQCPLGQYVHMDTMQCGEDCPSPSYIVDLLHNQQLDAEGTDYPTQTPYGPLCVTQCHAFQDEVIYTPSLSPGNTQYCVPDHCQLDAYADLCQNGGQCVNLDLYSSDLPEGVVVHDDKMFCHCPSSYGGDVCEIPLCQEECHPSHLCEQGECVPPQLSHVQLGLVGKETPVGTVLSVEVGDELLVTWSYSGNPENYVMVAFNPTPVAGKVLLPQVFGPFPALNVHVDEDPEEDEPEDDDANHPTSVTAQHMLRLLGAFIQADSSNSSVKIIATEQMANTEGSFSVYVANLRSVQASTLDHEDDTEDPSPQSIIVRSPCDSCNTATHKCVNQQCVCKYDETASPDACPTHNCLNGGAFDASGKCQCPSPFEGSRCQRTKLCPHDCGNGYLTPQSILPNGTCAAEITCECEFNWLFAPQEDTCVHCSLNPKIKDSDEDAPGLKCHDLGTSSITYTSKYCKTCLCNYGYFGERCHMRSVFGVVNFAGREDIQITPQLLASQQLQHIIKTELKQSMPQIGSQTIEFHISSWDVTKKTIVLELGLDLSKMPPPPTPTPPVDEDDGEEGTDNEEPPGPLAVTASFRLLDTEHEDQYMQQLYDEWSTLSQNVEQTPFGNGVTAEYLGAVTPNDQVYDPNCIADPTKPCPTGPNPYPDWDPTKDSSGAEPTPDNDQDDGGRDTVLPDVKSGSSKTTTIIIVVVVVAVVLLAVIGVIVGLLYCRKRNLACFQKGKGNKKHGSTNTRNGNSGTRDSAQSSGRRVSTAERQQEELELYKAQMYPSSKMSGTSQTGASGDSRSASGSSNTYNMHQHQYSGSGSNPHQFISPSRPSIDQRRRTNSSAGAAPADLLIVQDDDATKMSVPHYVEDVDAENPLREGWRKCLDHNGKAYYLNSETLKSQWKRPGVNDDSDEGDSFDW